MARNFKTARLIKGLKVAEAIKLLGISQPTLSAWEGERKSPSIEKLVRMAEIYDTSVDYLLGLTGNREPLSTDSVSIENLPILHGKPVWSPEYGWLLVNSIDQCFQQTEGTTIPFTATGKLYINPPIFSESEVPQEIPLTLGEILLHEDIWVEPISMDDTLRNELRGWYHKKERFVENEYGNRFYLDTYGAKWLGFDNEVIR